MKKKTEEKIARKITEMALDTVKNSVGKSFPYGVHEVKMPECVKAEFLNQKS